MSISDPKLTVVSIKEIQMGERRAADPDKVQRLAASIRETGLLQPIGITRDSHLIYGLHRIEAYKSLRRKKIPAVILDLDDLHAELAEIDENLLRNDLGAMELGEALVRRKEIYEQLHPETKHGGDRKSKAAKSSGNNCHLITFAEDVAQKMGKSARTVRLYMSVAERIPHDLRRTLGTTVVGKKIKELEKLSTLPEADQRAVVERIVDGAGSVADAIKTIGEPRSPQMRKIVAAKQVTRGNRPNQARPGNGTASACDAGDKAPEVGRAEEMPSEEVCASVDAPTEDDIDTETPREVEADLPTEPYASCDQAPDEEESNAIDPVAVYRGFLQELPERIRFLDEHLDEVVGYAPDSSEAVEVLQQAINFFEIVLEAESALAERPVEMDPMPCGA